MTNQEAFTFNISLSVLNHLGRNLYRNFITILGEAISNSRDADAENVWIYIDDKKNDFIIKDDGIGMSTEDFQNKFLKIGYSKRKDTEVKSKLNRPYIGRKGIGKLALLSCAKKISVLSKNVGGTYIGGSIDNSGLDKAILDDLNPEQYPLEKINDEKFVPFMENHEHGTIIYFEGLNDGVKNSFDYLKKLIALYFRFSLLDSSFNIYLNSELITQNHLSGLAEKTQFLWKINNINDPYINQLSPKRDAQITIDKDIIGFIASVEKPSDLKVIGTDERLSVDLFVNGRLREKDILKHMPTSRIAENYLYGQIHFNELDDDGIDRFTSSREGIVADDPKYQEFLVALKDSIILKVIEQWDEWRIENRDDGDPENPRIPKKERKSRELFNIVSTEYTVARTIIASPLIDGRINSLAEDAQYNFSSYAECFISENLLRKYITHMAIDISTLRSHTEEVIRLRAKEIQNKAAGNINIDIRQNNDDLSYLDMSFLTSCIDPRGGTLNTLVNDAKEYKPIRDAIAHTGLLTNEAKTRLTSVYDNIRSRIRNLLSGMV